jgi:hypothetical protein
MPAIVSQRTKALSGKAFDVARGLARFLARGEADMPTWSAMLDLHCMTNGRSTDVMRSVMRGLKPAVRPIKAFDSLLGHFEPLQVRDIAEGIRRNGHYVFDNRLPGDICDEITAAALRIEARAGRKADSGMAVFDPQNPVGHVYDIAESACWQIPAFQRILADPLFPNLAQSYFKAAPALKSSFLWWSAVLDGKPDTDAAQLFHFDYDPAPIWLKFFIYLTDVTPTSGPHVFVAGSHRPRRPESRELLSRHYVRIPDEDIERAYGKESIIEFTGQRGTVLAVDTLGFHKGKAPTSSHRLLGQLVYATPLFVPSASDPLEISSELDAALVETIRAYPKVFRRYRFPRFN